MAEESNRTPFVTIEGLTKHFDSWSGETTTALEGLTASIRHNEFVCVIGASGCGKSTLLNLLAGFEAPTTGRVLVDGTAIGGPSAQRAVIFQDVQGSLMPWLTSRENVELGLRLATRLDRQSRYTKAQAALESVGLSAAVEKYPFELSGGMQQRVQIARALALAPRLLLMDEPYGALDYLTRAALQKQLEQLYLEQQFSVVLVTHDITEAVLLADTIWIMDAGRLVEQIPVPCARPRELADPEVGKIVKHLRGELLSESASPQEATHTPGGAPQPHHGPQ